MAFSAAYQMSPGSSVVVTAIHQRMNHINKSHLCVARQLGWVQLVAFESWKPESKASFKQNRLTLMCSAHALQSTFRDASQFRALTVSAVPVLIQIECERARAFGFLSMSKGSCTTKACSIYLPADWSPTSVTDLWIQIYTWAVPA